MCIRDSPWTDLETHLPAEMKPVNRNQLASMVLDRLLAGLARFEASGFSTFRSAWNEHDLLQGRAIRLDHRGTEVAGTARGIDDDGGLLLDTGAGDIQVFHSGEVSVNP